MITFAVAVFFLLITPGPGVLSTAGVGSGFGYRPGVVYIAGLFVGTNLVALAVATGLAAVVLADPVVRTVLTYASAAYLLYLALKIAFAGKRIAFIKKPAPPGFVGGLLLQFINPKAYAVNTTLFSGFLFWPENYAVEAGIKFLILNAIWLPIHFLWLGAGVTLHSLNLPEKTVFAINCLMATSMLVVVALAAYSAGGSPG